MKHLVGFNRPYSFFHQLRIRDEGKSYQKYVESIDDYGEIGTCRKLPTRKYRISMDFPPSYIYIYIHFSNPLIAASRTCVEWWPTWSCANTLRINFFEAQNYLRSLSAVLRSLSAVLRSFSAVCAKSVFIIDHETGRGDLAAWFVENGNKHEEYLY